jgi:hypothetical protein
MKAADTSETSEYINKIIAVCIQQGLLKVSTVRISNLIIKT